MLQNETMLPFASRLAAAERATTVRARCPAGAARSGDLDTTPSYRRQRDVRFRRLGEEAVVLRQESAEVLVLNEVGGRILELVERGHDAGQIVSLVASEFEVASDQVEHDVAEFLAELCAAGILERVEPPPRP